MRRALFWTAVLLALSGLIGGAAYAYYGYRATSGPDGAVRGYFAALARSDAPAALGFGAVPSGPHEWLTSEVLAEQQRIAPLRDVRILGVARAGDKATVRYSYQLRFARGTQEVTGAVRVVHGGSGWRLASTAVGTAVRLDQAADRVAFAGSTVPDGPTLLFPGALPVRLDTPYLQIDPSTAAVQFAGGSTTRITLEPTAGARTALLSALGKRVTACVSGAKASASCPLPSTRFVPGSVVGSVVGGLGSKIDLRVGTEATGTITMTGTLTFQGRYRELDFDNVAHAHSGRLALRIEAAAYAVAPLTVRFVGTT